MSIKIIVAVAKNNAIGKDNKMPWHLPEDLMYFKNKTLGHTVIMGRKTLDSLGRALPDRKNIVITRQESVDYENVVIYHSLKEAIADEPDAFIMGGADIYRQSMDLADLLYITHIDAEMEADRFFPEIDPAIWEKQSSDKMQSKSGIILDFAIYKRKA